MVNRKQNRGLCSLTSCRRIYYANEGCIEDTIEYLVSACSAATQEDVAPALTGPEEALISLSPETPIEFIRELLIKFGGDVPLAADWLLSGRPIHPTPAAKGKKKYARWSPQQQQDEIVDRAAAPSRASKTFAITRPKPVSLTDIMAEDFSESLNSASPQAQWSGAVHREGGTPARDAELKRLQDLYQGHWRPMYRSH